MVSIEELMFSNVCGEESWESLGLQGDQTCQSWKKSTLTIGRTDFVSETLILSSPDAKSGFTGKDLDTG